MGCWVTLALKGVFMRKVNTTIEQIIDKIQSLKGQEVDLEVTRGRKKAQKIQGTIESVYPSIFTVKSNLDGVIQSLSYSYADVLCGDVSFKSSQKN